MTLPRKRLVSVSDTPYYHIVTRCVRRAFLCGKDPYTNTCYEHRRDWLVERIKRLSTVFAVDICAYAVMSNHYHLVIKLNPGQATNWSTKEIIRRWRLLYRGHTLAQRFAAGDCLFGAELTALNEITAIYRDRLCDLSWFVKCLNEPIAREANKEDNCTGRFWESRFKSQALLDDAALLTAMAYVDLNPIRAKMARTPECSDYTSIQERIRAKHNPANNRKKVSIGDFPSKPLVDFATTAEEKSHDTLPYRLTDYLELIDWTGRVVRNDKRGAIPNHLPAVLERLNINEKEWSNNCLQFEARYYNVIGRAHRVQHYILSKARKWCRGQHTLERMFA